MTTSTKLKVSRNILPLLGSDPELFLSSNGEIIGAERVIPPDGITPNKFLEKSIRRRVEETYKVYGDKISKEEVEKAIQREITYNTEGTGNRHRVVLDGVQVELHPAATGCRQNANKFLSYCLGALSRHLEDHPEVKIDWSSVVEISEKEYGSLSDSSKLLGCQPSLNIYDGSSTIEVPPDYRVRSAGGHLHFGLHDIFSGVDLRRLVLLMDIFVGNTMVLLDRNPLQKTRREVYGRAGEYRLPKYGLEYRTLSNFWLRDPLLSSLAYGMARLACAVLWHTELAGGGALGKPLAYPNGVGKYYDEFDAEREILKRISIDAIRTAINENNYDQALENWQSIKGFIQDHVKDQSCSSDFQFGMSPGWIKKFDLFISKPVSTWFAHMDDPLLKWHVEPDLLPHTRGWDYFIGAEFVGKERTT